MALILFSSLTETIGSAFQPHFRDLQALLLKCLQDETSNRVRVAALKYDKKNLFFFPSFFGTPVFIMKVILYGCFTEPLFCFTRAVGSFLEFTNDRDEVVSLYACSIMLSNYLLYVDYLVCTCSVF